MTKQGSRKQWRALSVLIALVATLGFVMGPLASVAQAVPAGPVKYILTCSGNGASTAVVVEAPAEGPDAGKIKVPQAKLEDIIKALYGLDGPAHDVKVTGVDSGHSAYVVISDGPEKVKILTTAGGDGSLLANGATIEGTYKAAPGPGSDALPFSFTINLAPQAAKISYETTSVTKTYGDSSFTNELTDTGDAKTNNKVTYSTDDTQGNVVEVDAATGAITIKGQGTATITATAPQNTDLHTYTGDDRVATYTITVNEKPSKISYSTTSLKKTTSDGPFTNALTDTGDAKATNSITYSIQGPEGVASIDGTGKVTIVGEGTVTIIAEVIDLSTGNCTYTGNSGADGVASYKLTVKDQEEATLTFNLAGGKLDGKSGPIKVKANVGDTIYILDAPTRSGYTFEYWKGSKYYPGDEYVVEGDHEFTAVWSKNSSGKKDSGNKTLRRVLPQTGDPTPLAAIAGLALSGSLSLVGGAAIRPRRRRGKHFDR